MTTDNTPAPSSRRRLRRAGVCVAVPLLVTVALGAAVSPARPAPPLKGGTGRNGAFTISGSTSGLWPGTTVNLVLALTNHKRFTIVVTSVQVSAGGTRTCRAGKVTATSFTGRLRIRAHKTVHQLHTVTMLHSAPDGCQGARIPLTYHGLAQRG
jgi:hypothetical protein